MTCDLVLKINKGVREDQVASFGADTTVRMLTENDIFDEADFVMKRGKLATLKVIAEKDGDKKILKSVFLTNSNNIDIKKITRLLGENTVNKFITNSLGVDLQIIQEVNKYFGNKNKIKSSINNEATPIIVEDPDFDTRTDSDREYFTIDRALINKLRKLSENPDSSITSNREFNKYIKFFITSALERGYSINSKIPLSIDGISQGISKFKILNPGNKVRYASVFQSSEKSSVVERIRSTESFIENIDNLENNNEKFIEIDGNEPLNYFLSKEDRTLMNKFKKVPRSSKIFIANNIAKAFGDLIPNMKVTLMTTSEIAEEYNEAFSTKNGFIIGGNIIINLDTFTPDTMFHEFGHFYMKWLDSFNPNLKQQILDTMKSRFPSTIDHLTTLYEGTKIDFSTDEILEEVFVSKVGLEGFKGLSKVINFDETVVSENTVVDISDSVQNFTYEFVSSLLGVQELPPKIKSLGINFSVADMIQASVDYGTFSGAMFSSDNIREDIKSINNFVVKKANIREITIGLINRGFIKQSPNGNIILLDENSNMVDENGDITNKPLNIKSLNSLGSLKKISNYLDKFKDYAEVLFDIGTTMATTESDVLSHTNSIIRNSKNKFQLEGVVLDGTTALITKEFSSNFDIEEAVKKRIFYDRRNKVRKAYIKKGLSKNEAENKALKNTEKYMVSEEAIKDGEAVKKIYEFKRVEGTYLHNINELFVLALNYSQEIDYGDTKKHGLTYYSEHIKNAILSGDKVILQTYFDKYFFRHLTNVEDTPKFKQFEKAYKFIFNNVIEEDKLMVNNLLSKLETFLKRDVFKNLTGPLKLLPEVVIGDKELGLVGIIDLLVIDGDGVIHIFDYKTKEIGTLENWDYSKGSVRMKGSMGSFYDNAMMKASIQASIYKYILKRKGFNVGSIAVAYVEANIRGKQDDDVFNDKEKLRYDVKKIFSTHLIDVTSEVVEHFTSKGSVTSKEELTNDASEITALSIAGAGGLDVNTPKDIEAASIRIYDRALNRSSEQSDASRVLAKFLNKGDNGLRIILPGNIRHTIPKEISTEDSQIEYIKDLLENRKDVSFVETDLETVFYSLDREKNTSERKLGARDKEKTIRNLLHGVDANTWEFVKFSSDINYGVDFKGVSFLKNKITKEVRIISLNYDDKKFLPFREGHFNILGNYISTRKLKGKYPELANLKNTNYNMRLLKVGLMIIRAKQLDPSFKISHILMNRDLRGDDKMPIKIDMLQLMALTKAFLNEASEAGEKLPAFFEDALQYPEIFNPPNFIPDPIKALSNYIGSSQSNRNVYNEVFSTKTTRSRATTLKSIIDNYDERTDFKLLLHSLQELQHSLDGNFTSFDQKLKSDLWTLLSNSILFVQGFNYTVNPKNTSFMQKFFFTPSTVSNKYMADFNRQITEGNAGMRSEFISYKKEFNFLIKSYAEEKGANIDVNSSSLYKSSRKDILLSLFVDPQNTDKKKAFLLKPASEATTKIEKDLINFINNHLKEYSKKSVLRGDIDIKQGWLPLVKKSSLSRRSDSNYFQNAVESIKNTFSSGESLKEDIDSSENFEKEFYVTNPFDSQLPGKKDNIDDQFTYARRKQLGIDEFGDPVTSERDTFNDIEDNIENILDAFMVASLNVIHFKDITAFGRSMFYNIKKEEGLTGENYDNIIDVLTIIQKKNIKNKESDKGNIIGEGFNKLATTAVIAGSIKQVLLEAFTNPLITADNWLSDKLFNTLFQGQREFSSKSYRKAMNIILNPIDTKDKKLAHAIDLFYGFSNSDSREMQRMLRLLEGNSIFQSKHLMYLNKLFLESWQKVSMVAYMIEQGSFNAHSLDDKGNIVYNESQDQRFYGPGDTKYKKKFYEATKLKLAKEYGGLTEDSSVSFEERSINKAYTSYDINYLKEKLVELYSSLDNTSKSMSIYYTWMAFINKMRTWIFAKMSRYFKKPVTAEENTSFSRLERVEDPSAEDGFKLEWRGQANEGILFSLLGLTRMFREEGFAALKNKNMTTVQKRNLSKLSADLIIGVALSGAAWGLFKGLGDDDKPMAPMAQLMYDRFQMATGDVFMLKALMDMVSGQGSLFIGVSIISGAIQKSIDAVMMTGMVGVSDKIGMEDIGAAYWGAAAAFYGPFKTVDVGIEQFQHLDVE